MEYDIIDMMNQLRVPDEIAERLLNIIKQGEMESCIRKEDNKNTKNREVLNLFI